MHIIRVRQYFRDKTVKEGEFMQDVAKHFIPPLLSVTDKNVFDINPKSGSFKSSYCVLCGANPCSIQDIQTCNL